MRKPPRQPRTGPFALAAGVFGAGILVGWLAHAYGPPPARVGRGATPVIESSNATKAMDSAIAGTSGSRVRSEATSSADTSRADLRLPIDGMHVDIMKGGFAEQRRGHEHEAVDIIAPRNTPIHAVSDGTIAKLFYSKGGGGNTVYQFDPDGRLCFYYAHLERYEDGLRDQQKISKGDVIGYVGTSGNAPPNTPHLHFAVFQLDETRRWWKGRALDPYIVFSERRGD